MTLRPDDGDELDRALRPIRSSSPDGVRWTAAFSVGAAIAGVLWGSVFYVSGLRPDGLALASSSRTVALIAGCCLAVTASGAALAAGSRRRFRTAGVALLVAGLVGPGAAGLGLAAQSYLGRSVVLAIVVVVSLAVWTRRRNRPQRPDRIAGWDAATHTVGLLIGVAVGFVLVVAMFVYAGIALILLAVLLGLSPRTRGLAGGVVAAVIGIATFVATVYLAMAVFGA